MSNRVLHKQLASIMEVLANTAVAEICKIVDDGYAVLRLEMSQSMKENDALRRKLQGMELRVARGCPEKTKMRESPVHPRSDGSHLSELKGITTVPEESYFFLDQQMAVSPRRGGESTTLANGDQCTDMEERRTEALLIKEERVEEDRDPQREMKPEEERAVEWRAGSREKRPVQETQNKPANHTEELTEQHRTRRAVWEVSGLESALKAEGESECVETPQHRGTEHRAEGLNRLDSEFVMFERPGQLGSYCTQGGAVTETEDPCCSYSTEKDPHSLCFHSELQSVSPAAGNGPGNSLSVGCAHAKSDSVLAEAVPSHMEDEIHTLWNQDLSADRGFTAYGLYNVEGKTKTQLNNNASLCASYVQMHTREKLFICTYCGKGFNRPKKLEIHQRIHTGEKPFSCSLCGKRFAQSCNLNRHKIVHTGEKPFSCAQCGKRFTQSCHLKTHQRVHARARPYSCNRFSEKRSLRVQQHRKHTGI